MEHCDGVILRSHIIKSPWSASRGHGQSRPFVPEDSSHAHYFSTHGCALRLSDALSCFLLDVPFAAAAAARRALRSKKLMVVVALMEIALDSSKAVNYPHLMEVSYK